MALVLCEGGDMGWGAQLAPGTAPSPGQCPPPPASAVLTSGAIREGCRMHSCRAGDTTLLVAPSCGHRSFHPSAPPSPAPALGSLESQKKPSQTHRVQPLSDPRALSATSRHAGDVWGLGFGGSSKTALERFWKGFVKVQTLPWGCQLGSMARMG